MSVPVLISIAGVIFCIGAFAYFKSYINKRTSGDSVLAGIRDEINRLLIRMDETTNRDISLLEDKEQSLKKLLEETEKRIKVYARELDRSLVNERVYRELGSRASLGSSASAESPASAFVESVKPPEEQIAHEPPDPKAAPIGEQIRALANSGFSSTVIASKLGISISEVELGLAVLERKPLARTGLFNPGEKT